MGGDGMNDWVMCATCRTIYEYDPERRIAECPYCRSRETEERGEPKRDAAPVDLDPAVAADDRLSALA
jgi:hypothetical protein